MHVRLPSEQVSTLMRPSQICQIRSWADTLIIRFRVSLNTGSGYFEQLGVAVLTDLSSLFLALGLPAQFLCFSFTFTFGGFV